MVSDADKIREFTMMTSIRRNVPEDYILLEKTVEKID